MDVLFYVPTKVCMHFIQEKLTQLIRLQKTNVCYIPYQGRKVYTLPSHFLKKHALLNADFTYLAIYLNIMMHFMF